MKTFDIIVPVEELDFSELSPAEQKLVETACKATYRSYAPYSRFSVGAAVELDDGTVVAGSNQENAAYPSSLCAERTAAYYAHSTHPDRRFRAIAIAARGTDGEFLAEPVSPCGACRQALLQYEHLAGNNVTVLLVGADKIHRLPSVRSLLPFAFTSF